MTALNTEFLEELELYVQAALSRKAEALVVLDVRGLTSIADAFIICSGRSNRQVIAIAENIQLFLRERGIRPLHVEGQSEAPIGSCSTTATSSFTYSSSPPAFFITWKGCGPMHPALSPGIWSRSR